MNHAHLKSFLIIFWLLGNILTPVLAEESSKKELSNTVSQKTFDSLTEIQKLIQSNAYDKALNQLNTLKNDPDLNSYGKSQIWNLYAYVYAQQEQFQEAIVAYKNLLNEPDAPAKLKDNASYTLAQIYFQLDDYKNAIALMQQWLDSTTQPTSTAYILLAQSHYQNKTYDAGLKYLHQAFSTYQHEQKLPEGWLELEAAFYLDMKRYEDVLQSYRTLLANYPKAKYLYQMAAIYSILEDNHKYLGVLDTLYLDDKLTQENELLNLAYLYLNESIPHKAGKIIESGIDGQNIEPNQKNTELLVDSWIQAKEYQKAITTLEAKIEHSAAPEYYTKLARIYFQQGDNKKVLALMERANKTPHTRSHHNHMIHGMALYHLKEYEQALQVFRQAKKHKETFVSARKWEQHTLQEIKRKQIIDTHRQSF